MMSYLQRSTPAAPLAFFRIALGLLIFASIVRFWAKGWIHELYVEPRHFFPFYGFEFVRPLGDYTYALFALCAVASLMVALGWHYRVAIITLFVTFTYIELMDKATYLNHYYFISMICLMMIFLPAHIRYSIDARRVEGIAAIRMPAWCLHVLKLFVCVVYFYAGLAKINSDWLFNAQPLRIWLPAHNDLPLIGPLLDEPLTAYIFSWAGCLYDLTIPFLLLSDRTRLSGFVAVVLFHTLTAILFPIGMFPFIMMATALIFFPPEFHEKIVGWFSRLIPDRFAITSGSQYLFKGPGARLIPLAFSIFLLLQVAIPLRHICYPGELFWTEEGYRFSWRVMLMEKAGFAEFTVIDNDGKRVLVDNRQFLTPLQEKMMSTQPDMILQYARILHDHYEKQGFRSPRVYVDSYVTLNGRLGKPLVNPDTDLAGMVESFEHKDWLLPFGDEITGI